MGVDQYELSPTFPISENYSGSDLMNPNDDPHNDNINDYLLFYNVSINSIPIPNFDECLDVDEMNFYYESMSDLAESIMPYPAGITVIGNIEVGYNNYSSLGSIRIWHGMEVLLVNKFYTLEEDEEAIPLPCCP